MKLWSALTGRWQLWRSGLFLFGGLGAAMTSCWPGQIDLGKPDDRLGDRTGCGMNRPGDQLRRRGR